jgi:phospholipid/cholesterol/gamma-HCH transport system permease protein
MFKIEIFRTIGSNIFEAARFLGGITTLLYKCIRDLMEPPIYWRLVLEQMYLLGVQSFLLVAVTALATGSVMTLQFGYGLEKFGGKLYIPRIVSLSIVKEMGPVFTSLLVAGRIGSGMAAEVASMKVTQQIDAISALGTCPIRRIVIPRLLATLITLPLLTIMADFIALFGGMLVAKSEIAIPAAFFYQKCLDTLRPIDFSTGLIKAFVFALFIGLTACYKGLNSKGGTKGVGDTTTFVVVSSSIFIMIADFFLTKLFLITLPYAQ